MNDKNKKQEDDKATPSWSYALPLLILSIQSDNPDAVKIAEEELINMARVADLYNDLKKTNESD